MIGSGEVQSAVESLEKRGGTSRRSCPRLSRGVLAHVPRQPEGRATDLYVMHRKPDGTWTYPTHLGSPINPPKRESNPTFSPDRKYLFFTRHGKTHWASAAVLERPRAEKLGR